MAHQTRTQSPRRLTEARAALGDLPASLEVRGQLAELPLAIAIVGARAASGAEMALAGALAAAVARRGGLVVSGGALGVDGAAHRGALAAGGATVAVLATGIDLVYPARHASLFSRITLATQFERGAPPIGWRFVKRNAVIAALADRVIVVGAALRSGALHTAAACTRLGRPVGAAPGAEGCDRLLAGGAARVGSVADLDAWLDGLAPSAERLPPPADELGRRVLAACTERARAVEDIADGAGLALRDVQRVLTELELAGLVRAAPGQTYRRNPLASVTA